MKCQRIDDLGTFFSVRGLHIEPLSTSNRGLTFTKTRKKGKKCTITFTNQSARPSHFNKSCICPSSYKIGTYKRFKYTPYACFYL